MIPASGIGSRFVYELPDNQGEVQVLHLLSYLGREVGWSAIASRVKRSLTGLRIAPYYGCLLTRPPETAIEPDRDFSLLMRLLACLGAEAVYFEAADRCCGSYQSVGNPNAALEATAAIVAAATQLGVDALAVACPLCEFNLAHHQKRLVQANRLPSPLPAVFFTQRMACGFGLCTAANGFDIEPAGMQRLW